MKAAIVEQAGHDPIGGDFPEPEPIDGEQVFELVGAGVHQVVRSLASGRHYGSSGRYPQVPGVDAVARTSGGDLVYTGHVRAPWGTMAQRMAARLAIPVPVGADPLAVAAGMNPAGSGWWPLKTRHNELGGLGTVWVLGATGMSGRLAVQEAFLLGAAQVVAVGRNQAVLEQLRASGAVTVDLGNPDATTQLGETGDPELVLDYVWGDVAQLAFAALGRTGLHEDTADISYVQIGSLAGAEAAVPSTLLRSRRLRLSGSGAGSVSTQQMLQQLPELIGHIAGGRLEVPYTAYPIAEVERAWSHTGPTRAVVVPGS